jgi:hypothetical protein
VVATGGLSCKLHKNVVEYIYKEGVNMYIKSDRTKAFDILEAVEQYVDPHEGRGTIR